MEPTPLPLVDQDRDLLGEQVVDGEPDVALALQPVGEDRRADAGGERIGEVLLEAEAGGGRTARLGRGRLRYAERDRQRRQEPETS
jgi:hypothetical protein